MKTTITCACFLIVLLGAPRVHADNDDTIEYRRHIMKTLDEEVGAIEQILAKRVPAESLSTHLSVLAITASTAKKAFQTKVPGGQSKPDVWSNWPDFAKRLDTLTSGTAEMARLATSGGIAAVAAKFHSAVSCDGCHQQYIAPETKGK